jgi:hypothetical protein
MKRTGTNNGVRPPTGGGPCSTGALRLRVLLLVAVAISGATIYEASRCSEPLGGRPVFGDFTIHCEWRDRTVRSLKIYDCLTHRRPRLDPISRALINRMALTVARQELSRLGTIETQAQIDIRVFGRVLPCGAAVLATEFTNQSAPNFKPRPPTERPPGHPGAYPL